jgi:hypothetical protein
VQDWSRRVGVSAELHTSGLLDDRLASEAETTLYRIAQEALTNVAKHARATKVDVILERRSDHVLLVIEDDGVGFDPGDRAAASQGFGLLGMQERAALVGAVFAEEAAARSMIELAIMAESIVLKDAWIGRGDAKRVHKMASRKMLSVEEFPELRFASSRICERADSQYELDGTLTLRAIARPVQLTLRVEEHIGECVRLSGHAGIKLTDFRLKPPSFLFGVIGTRDEIDVEFVLTGRPTGLRHPAAGHRMTQFD